MGTRLSRLIAGAVLVAAALAFSAGQAHSESDLGGIQTFWMDSLRAVNQNPVLKEHPLQFYFDSLGYDIDVGEDELGSAVFCGLDGLNTATMVIEVAGSAVYATSGYYQAGDTSTLYQLFGPSDGPGDSVQFTFASFDSVGFYMKPNLPGQVNTWLSEEDLNWDSFDHAWVFATGIPHEFLICWEDLPNGGDQDYQDLVVKIRFANQEPTVQLPADYSVVLCQPEQVCFDISAIDANCEGDSIWLSMVEGEGTFATVAGLSTIDAQHCFTPSGDGTYRFIFEVEDILGAIGADTVDITVSTGTAPTVTISDTSVFFCDPGEICLPVLIMDPDCDVVSVSSNIGSYGGDEAGFDQIAMLDHLGGSVTQVGGGAPGKTLAAKNDFVPPVNSQSGVTVTLPDFVFASQVVQYGTFSSSPSSQNCPIYVKGAPTDLTYTSAGAGGPDGGPGDGSIQFGQNSWCVMGFAETITTCNGAVADLILFTNTAAGGPATIKLRLNGVDVHTMSSAVSGGTSGSGLGGNTFDLPDGITFNQIYIANSGTKCPVFEIDAIAARTGVGSGKDLAGFSGEVCFFADAPGVYEIIVTAEDSCGNVGTGTAFVTVDLNDAPVANAGPDKNLFLCAFDEICFDVSFSDPDDNIASTQLLSGPGALNGNQICYTPTAAGTSTFVVRVTDECGELDLDTVLVTVNDNDPPVATVPGAITRFLCDPIELCFDFAATDPNGGPLVWSHIAGVGTITPAGHHCFTPTVSGSYTTTAAVTDSCGAADTVSLTYYLTINTPPVATNPATPASVFQCVPTEICYQFAATDPQGGTLVWSRDDGDGTVTSGGLWCFTPTATGSYYVNVTVADSCGETDQTTLTYNVTLNETPSIAFEGSPDTTILLCDPQAICLPYTVSDPQGLAGLVEDMPSGYGAIDTAANQVCFTPTTAGDYAFQISVTDPCSETAYATKTVHIQFGQAAAIDCPIEPIEVFLCEADEVCQALGITPATATVSVSFGTYSGGNLCFMADTSGVYDIRVIAEDECGADTCMVSFEVEIGQAAQIDCPDPSTKFICAPGQVCVPVGIFGTGVTVTVAPIGTYASGNVCFAADTSGHYEITVTADAACGSDECLVVVDVIINSPPVAVDPATPVDTFICAAGQICYQFAANDINGGALTWSRLSGNGTMTADGLWCINASATGVKTVQTVVTDACGAADTTTLTYNITLNSAPTISLGPDAPYFRCTSGQVCHPYTVGDVDDNVAAVEIIAGTGTLNTTTNELCFDATVSGSYAFTVKVTDECGATATDDIVITIDLNEPPTVNAGADQTIFRCVSEEICWSVSSGDPDGNLVSVELVNGPGVLNGNTLCFTPTATWLYEFVLKATDACGATDFDTVVVDFTLNTPPVAGAGADQTLFQCTPTPICWTAGCTDVDGNLSSCSLVEGPGSYNGSQICFTPAASGSYTFVIEAVDACGATDRDTAVIAVTLNSAPVCSVPANQSFFQCTPTQVSLPVSATDVDGNLESCDIISGPGELVGGYWCYTPSADQAVTVTIHCEDECGAFCESSFTIDFDINGAPSIAFGADFTRFLCASETICMPYTAADPDARPNTISLLEGPGTLDLGNSQVCFTPTAAGYFTFIVRIEDECGKADQDTINVIVQMNTPPVADAGADQTLFLCDSTETVCWTAGCSDVDGNLTQCLFDGPGEFDGSEICFNPVVTGEYLFTLQAVDACGQVDRDTVRINVTINSDPVIAFGADENHFLCAPQQICLPYTVSDADGLSGLIETMNSGFGSIDTAANQVCFTPTVGGVYEFVVGVTDPCDDMDVDTVVVTVTFGEEAEIDCPTEPIEVSLCAAEEICYLLPITPAGATVTTSYGTWANGELCFMADTSGVYEITVEAEEDCGGDLCVLTFNVDIGEAAEISCPGPQTRFICQAGTVCIPISVMTPGATVEVTPTGSYSAGNVCFPADTSGHYELHVVATTTCGSDECDIVVDVTINSAPVAGTPPSHEDPYFLCAPEAVCTQFTASDVDGGALTWERISGNGTVTSDGLWCFTPTVNGMYNCCARVSDACGAADTVCLSYNIVLNSPPSIAFTRQTQYFLCSPAQICLDYTVADVDDNVAVEQLLLGAATVDTVANKVCFQADTAGTYQFRVAAIDVCGAADTATTTVTVAMNRPPVAEAGPVSTTLFACESGVEHSWTVGCSDPDGNLTDCELLLGAYTYFDGTTARFAPDTSGAYLFVLRATDECGATDYDSTVFVVTINTAPVCQLPEDAAFFQCAPTKVTLPFTVNDVDDNQTHCEIISGPGSIVGTPGSGLAWEYTPTGDQNATVRVMCLDACGASCEDEFHVSFDINDKPVVDAGSNALHFLCGPETICWPVSAFDANGNLETVELITSFGQYHAGSSEICFAVPPGERSYPFILEAVDDCGAVKRDTATITIAYNDPPTLDMLSEIIVYLEAPGEVCINAHPNDPDDNLSGVTVAPFGTYNTATERVCFVADTSGTYCLTVTVSDQCGEEATQGVCVQVVIDECIHVQIEKTHGTIQGTHESVSIYLNGSGKELGGFNLLVAYDATALNVAAVNAGELLAACGWEYFTWRHGDNGNCSGNGCPTGLLRLVAIAETNNGGYHPGCFLDGLVGSIADISFMVTNDRTFECMYAPVRFYWTDCGDNAFSDRWGDTLWISRHVYDFEHHEITDNDWGFPGFLGAPDSCLIGGGPGKPSSIRCVDFTNGGVDIICADSIDARADINLNGVAYEIADAVLFSMYFVYGLDVFSISVDGQIAASDVNADGVTLSVADLVYLIRVLVGDLPPMPKVAPGATASADFRLQGGVLTITDVEVPVGAISLVVGGDATPTLHDHASGMTLQYNFDGRDTRILVYDPNGRLALEGGPVLAFDSDVEIKCVEIGSFDGAVMRAQTTALPKNFELSQNYPNPFNPVTTMQFALPVRSEWRLSVYNVLGQTVATFEGESDPGWVKVQWNADRFASGVYFYRLSAGDFTATRKMVLLK